MNVLSIKLKQIHITEGDLLVSSRNLRQKSMKDIITLEVNEIHKCIRMSSAGIIAFVKSESNAKTYRSSYVMETFFLPNVKSLFVSQCCSLLVNTCKLGKQWYCLRSFSECSVLTSANVFCRTSLASYFINLWSWSVGLKK